MNTKSSGPAKINFDMDDEALKPTPVKADETVRAEAKKAAAALGFASTEAVQAQQPRTQPEAQTARQETPEILRRGRKKVIGRTAQFTVRLKPETSNAIYRIADDIGGVPLAEVIEMAMDALEREMRSRSSK